MFRPITKPIESDDELAVAEAEVDELWRDQAPEPGTPEADRLALLAILIDEYERGREPPAEPADPIEVLEFWMEQKGLSRKELEPFIGTRARVFEVMTRKRGLSIEMIRRLHYGLGIPAESLIGPPDVELHKHAHAHAGAAK